MPGVSAFEVMNTSTELGFVFFFANQSAPILIFSKW
jgi:hypothetical protein